MCFVKDIENWKKHQIAEDDIECFKLVYRSTFCWDWWRSDVMNYKYENGKDYHLDASPLALSKLDIRESLENGVFHSYSTLNQPEITKRLLGDTIEINRLKRMAEPFKEDGDDYYSIPTNIFCHVIKCIIPKGTPYWYNKRYKTYASTSIRIVNEIEYNVKIEFNS